jgi:hypothetical protein
MAFQRQPEVLPALASDIVLDPELARRARLTIVRQTAFGADEMVRLMDMLGILPEEKTDDDEL